MYPSSFTGHLQLCLGLGLSMTWIPACGADAEVERIATRADAIYGGVPDDDAARSPAVVGVRLDLAGTSYERCSGALVAPNVVLTARHCVTPMLNGGTVGCDARGRSDDGPHFGASPADPTRLHVFVGDRVVMSRPFATPPYAVTRVVHPDSRVVCDSDVALLVLARSVPDVTPLPMRLDAGAAAGERVSVVGFGHSDRGGVLPGTRMRRDDVPVLAIGPMGAVVDPTTRAARGPLGPNEFETGKGSCSGDSGGPAIARDGGVLGVASRGGDCALDADRIYTALAPFRSLIEQAFAEAGAAPLLATPSVARAHAAENETSSEPSEPGPRGTDAMNATVAARAGGCMLASPTATRGRASQFAALAAAAAVALWRRRRAAARNRE